MPAGRAQGGPGHQLMSGALLADDTDHGRCWPVLRKLIVAWVCLASPLLAGCLGDTADGGGRSELQLSGETVVDGLDGPTQLFIAEDGIWWVAQLAGGENDRSGQVIRIDPDNLSTDAEVVLDGLDKPTGLALFAGQLWVMERNRLTLGPVDGRLDGSDRTVVADQLPNNGRSQGTLTVDGGQLLYNTSGRLEDDGTPTPGSGVLWAAVWNGETGEVAIEPVADGFKHAYAHLRAKDGTLYTTEVSDGRFDGQPAADELVAVEPGVDHGWPQCVGDNRLVLEYLDANGDCQDSPRSTALFPSGATPTSVAPVPGTDELLAVALWNTGEVVVVSPGNQSTDYQMVYDGAERPQHLVLDGDGQRLLLTDHAAGSVVALTFTADS